MEFSVDTVYDLKTFTALARAIRKTVRKKRSRRSHILGWSVLAMGLALSLIPGETGFSVDFGKVLTLLAMLVMLAVLIFEDRMNGLIAKKRMLAGLNRSVCTFREDGYSSETSVGTSLWQYDKIVRIAELPDYFVFLFDANHGQIYDKNTLTGGTSEDFAHFISEKTGKPIEQLK